MLDRASIERLSRAPDKNAPILNVALAEEGTAEVLIALARSPAVGPDALEVIGERIARDGGDVGRDPDNVGDGFTPVDGELDRLLIAHPRSSDSTRDAVLDRNADDSFFVLAAACHPRATLAALERVIDWPSASPLHDRLWIALLDASAVPPLALESWAQDASALRREAAGRIGRDPSVLERLARDPSRQVRRAVASNRAFGGRAALAADDPAIEVRARAAGPAGAHADAPPPSQAAATSLLDSARLAAAYRVMASGGLVAPDVVRALSTSPAALDAEGATLAGLVLPRKDLVELVERVAAGAASPEIGLALASGIALRPPVPYGTRDDDVGVEEAEHAELVYDAVKCLSQAAAFVETRLTGKARLAAWAADGLAHATRTRADDRGVDSAWSSDRLIRELAKKPLAAERVILGRGASKTPALVAELVAASAGVDAIPPALVELAWGDAGVSDAQVVDLASRVAKPKKRAEDLPEDEVDLDPSRRSLDVLERAVLAIIQRANVAPRAALAAVALDARRVRYILAAMPQWKGRLTGGKLARVLRQHGAALTVAQAEARSHASHVEGWTERLMSEIELAIALAVGHLTAAEVARRILIGRQQIEDGLNLAAGTEARAAVEGAKAVLPLLDWATKQRTSHAGAFSVWLLIERIDRERAPSLISSSLDALASAKGAVAPSVTDALAAIEHRRPARLETVHPQSPRGRATLASAIARAYRAVGGMRDERQG